MDVDIGILRALKPSLSVFGTFLEGRIHVGKYLPFVGDKRVVTVLIVHYSI